MFEESFASIWQPAGEDQVYPGCFQPRLTRITHRYIVCYASQRSAWYGSDDNHQLAILYHERWLAWGLWVSVSDVLRRGYLSIYPKPIVQGLLRIQHHIEQSHQVPRPHADHMPVNGLASLEIQNFERCHGVPHKSSGEPHRDLSVVPL